MPRYVVYFAVHATHGMEVVAANEQEARKEAIRKARVSLCHHCSAVVGEPQLGEITEVEEIEE